MQDWFALNWLISFIYCVWPGAPEAELRRDLSEDKRGTNTAAFSGSPTSQLHRRWHQDSWLGRTQMQRISTRTCQIHSDGLSQRNSEISSERRGTSERRHDSFLPPILRVSALLPGPNGNENFVRAAQKKKKREKERKVPLISRSLWVHTQTACHWNQGLQTKALVHKGSLNIFVVLSVVLFFNYKIFCCFVFFSKENWINEPAPVGD